jgi:hypothetical protein
MTLTGDGGAEVCDVPPHPIKHKSAKSTIQMQHCFMRIQNTKSGF